MVVWGVAEVGVQSLLDRHKCRPDLETEIFSTAQTCGHGDKRGERHDGLWLCLYPALYCYWETAAIEVALIWSLFSKLAHTCDHSM